jgi:hypothetical protein
MLAEDFRRTIAEVVLAEAREWILLKQSTRSELETLVGTKLEAVKAGSLIVSIPNARDFDFVDVSLAGTDLLLRWEGETERFFPAVRPGVMS